MQTLFALSLGFAGVILATAHAAQPQVAPNRCGPRAEVLTLLAERYGESRRGMGLAGPQSVVELFAGDSGSWTVTVTLPDGRTCLVLSGQGWDDRPAALPASGRPA